ncbi:hypothetical protein DFQ28_005988 [Apophysomyces sp. BC1034]|nr:hypothetical protein DFQ30_002581 [Apophysomyces sp. BC1015]KAG0177366.1 hypothetical protein DFQ29_004914 [Apophysomyces sp. BC1021]KAG0187676.1 hypothetical protein DFQ28_005988 [Apophysomyces sp. BC1034]
MHSTYSITKASPEHITVLPAIEAEAATLLKGYVSESILSQVTDEEDFRIAQQEDRLWVALTEEKIPIGFALIEILDADHIHLGEIDVHPDHGRRGLGKALVTAICEWASRSKYSQVTLTTFRDVPWNSPFYARLGFQVIPTQELGPKLLEIMHDEAARGLDINRRVAMKYRCTA